MTGMRRRGIKRGESKLDSNHFLMCVLHSLDRSEMFTELYREEKREEGDRGVQEDKEGNQKERDRSSSNQFLKCSPLSGTHKEIHRVG